MSPRSHLLLTRHPVVTNAAGYSSAPVRRGVFRVSILPHRWIRYQFLGFAVYQASVHVSWYDLGLPISPQFSSVYQHLVGLFHKRLAPCPHVRIYH